MPSGITSHFKAYQGAVRLLQKGRMWHAGVVPGITLNREVGRSDVYNELPNTSWCV